MRYIGIVLVLTLSACASVQPTVKVVCSVCQSVCPLVSLSQSKALTCPQGELVIVNWKDVEKGIPAKLECKGVIK